MNIDDIFQDAPTIDLRLVVEQEGRIARAAGVHRDACPYKGGWERDWWLKGWDG